MYEQGQIDVAPVSESYIDQVRDVKLTPFTMS